MFISLGEILGAELPSYLHEDVYPIIRPILNSPERSDIRWTEKKEPSKEHRIRQNFPPCDDYETVSSSNYLKS